MGSKIFQNVSGLRPGRSVFNLSYTKLLACDMGQLIPIMADEMVPGDTFVIGNEVVLRLQPMVTPILHEVNLYIHYFFVPYRLLWAEPNGWQTFISGGVDGNQAPTLPRWSPSSTVLGSLWDYLGFPIGINPIGALPVKFPMQAYNFIYNEYYRDETQISAISLDTETIQKRAWEKDYFTSSLPWTQRGTAPALPIAGSAVWSGPVAVGGQSLTWPAVDGAGPIAINYKTGATNPSNTGSKSMLEAGAVSAGSIAAANLNANTLTNATFTISDLRLTTQIQKFLERNARAGSRYVEFLKAHFGVSPRDDRLQRPEYIGGSKSPVIVSEVLQTHASPKDTNQAWTTAQGTMAGHGITADRNRIATYTAQEFGIIMGIMSVMPKPMYSQGIDRQWLSVTKYDYYFPEFAHLSEQAIIRAELYADGNSGNNNTVFGYQGRYDHHRIKRNLAVAKFAYGAALPYKGWLLSREFGSAPALNQAFIECVPRKDFLASSSEPSCIVHVANIIKAVRPMPVEASPGMMDHF